MVPAVLFDKTFQMISLIYLKLNFGVRSLILPEIAVVKLVFVWVQIHILVLVYFSNIGLFVKADIFYIYISFEKTAIHADYCS